MPNGKHLKNPYQVGQFFDIIKSGAYMQIEEIVLKIRNCQQSGDQNEQKSLTQKLGDVKKWMNSQLFRDIEQVDDGEIRFMHALIDHYVYQLKEAYSYGVNDSNYSSIQSQSGNVKAKQ